MTGPSFTVRLAGFSETGSLATAREFHQAVLPTDGKVLVLGGHDAGNTTLASAEAFDPALGSFGTAGDMVSAREQFAAVRLSDGKVLITGGLILSGLTTATLAAAELYDPGTGRYTATGDMTTARWGHTATLLTGGNVLIVGGFGPTAPLASAELYDPSTGIFAAAGSLDTARYSHTATLLSNGNVLVAAGLRVNTINDAEKYDPATDNLVAGVL